MFCITSNISFTVFLIITCFSLYNISEVIMEHVKVNVSEGGIVFYDIFMKDEEHHIDAIRCIFNPSYNGREYDFEPDWKCIFDEYGQAHEEHGTHVEVPALSIRIFARIA